MYIPYSVLYMFSLHGQVDSICKILLSLHDVTCHKFTLRMTFCNSMFKQITCISYF